MSSDQQLNQIRQAIRHLASQGQWQQALAHSEQALNNHPDQASLWMDHAHLCFQLKRGPEVIRALQQACSLEPDNLAFQWQQIQALEAMGHVDDALRQAALMAEESPNDIRLIESLAALMNRHQQFEQARGLYRKATELQPAQGQWWLNLAMTEQYLGDMAAADESVARALTLNPNDCDSHFFRAHLRKQSREHNHLEALQNCINQLPGLTQLTPTERAKVYFAQAKELEDCARYDDSFAARRQGASIYRAAMPYEVDSDLGFMQAIGKHHNHQWLHQPPVGETGHSPIFIVGLPRSGTTLLERIIGSHDGITSAGELTTFNQCMLAELAQLALPPNTSRPDMVAHSVNINYQRLGQQYLAQVPPQFKNTSRFIDKFPQNAHYVGMIHRALPDARIIILERHPMDVCYAVYKQMFTDIYQFSYDLDELGRYYIEHQKLMQHWQQSLPDVVTTVRYEDLVTDLESTARRVLAFCRLDWQPQCLEFHRNQQASTTASASQVRQKIYASSIGLWRHYASQLEPLRQRLEQAGCLQGWD